MMSSSNKTDRMMANIAIAILSLGACYAVYSLGPPVWWRFYATVIRPFEDSGGIGVLDDDPFSSVLDTRSLPGAQGVHDCASHAVVVLYFCWRPCPSAHLNKPSQQHCQSNMPSRKGGGG